MALINKLTAVANAIRGKTGGTNELTLDEMAAEIENLEVGGGSEANPLQVLIDKRGNDASQLFSYQSELTLEVLNEALPLTDFSKVTNMLCMFRGCSALTTIPQIDTRSAVDMTSMFRDCSALTTIPQLDTSNVTIMPYMFQGCSSLTTIPQLDTSSVTVTSNMFYGCSALTTIPQLDTSGVKAMAEMFYGCSALTTIPQLDTSGVTGMPKAFWGCSALTTIPQLDTSKVLNMESMFQGCSALTTIPQLDTSKVQNMKSMFYGCSNLTTIPKLDTSNVTNTTNMFQGCSALTDCRLRNIKCNLTVGSGTSYGHLLTVDSLTHLIYELRDTGYTKTLTVGSANLGKLATVYVKTIEVTDEMRAEDDLVDEKLPFVVCESTDEGATLITEYAQLKHWSIT